MRKQRILVDYNLIKTNALQDKYLYVFNL